MPEEWIKDIEVNKILNDPAAFKKRVSSYSSQVLARKSDNSTTPNEKLSGENNIPERENQFEKKTIENSSNRPFVGRDKEYDGPLKSLRNKIKNILE